MKTIFLILGLSDALVLLPGFFHQDSDNIQAWEYQCLGAERDILFI